MLWITNNYNEPLQLQSIDSFSWSTGVHIPQVAVLPLYGRSAGNLLGQMPEPIGTSQQTLPSTIGESSREQGDRGS